MGWRRFFYKRFHGGEIRRVEGAFSRPEEAQKEFLLSLLAGNEDTDFGRRAGFSSCGSVEDYRRRVPVSTYEDYREEIARSARGEKNVLTAEEPVFFSLTSGTTGPEKIIPVTPSLERDMARAQVYWNARLIGEHEDYGRWKYLVLVSASEERRTEAGLPCRSVSSRVSSKGAGHVFRLRFLYRASMAVPERIFAVGDSRIRWRLIALKALSSNLGSITAANPSTIVHFCRFLHENRKTLIEDLARGEVAAEVRNDLGETEWRELAPVFSGLRPDPERAASLEGILGNDPFPLERVWQGLRIVNCWLGGTLSLYLARLRHYTTSLPLRDVGYRASEGFFAVPLENENPSGVLHVTGNFFEFVDESDPGRTPLLVHEIEPGRSYRMIVTQAGGLYRYDMEDVVEVTGYYQETPMIRFLHKAGDVLSLTGEKLSGLQVVRAVDRLQLELGLNRFDFVLTHSLEIPPSYLLLLEEGDDDAARIRDCPDFLRRMDRNMAEENVEYRAKRESGRLGPIRVLWLVPGTLEEWRSRRSRLHPHDCQSKPGRLLGEGPDRDWLLSRAIPEADEHPR